jgi:hypothetical protein
MAMRFHWLRECEAQEQFKFTWKPGRANLADYFTKHHPPAHHVNVRSNFLTKVRDLAKIRIQKNVQGQMNPQPAQAMTSFKGTLDSQELHTIASILLASRAENNLYSPRGRFLSDLFLCEEEAR